jgi:stage II sporulation protein M
MRKNKRLKIWDTIGNHVVNNKKEYILVTLIFLVGIFLGVMFINNSKENQLSEISSYFNNFIDKLKNTEKLETMAILKTTLLENIMLAVTLWFFGTTVIGIPIVFGIIMYRGFCLGYSIATIISVIGVGKGILFILITLVLQNILFIPALIAIGVSRI